MDRSQAIELLHSESVPDRLKAARYLAKTAVSKDISLLRDAFRKESVSYVRRALATAIERPESSAQTAIPVASEASQPSELRSEVYKEAVEEVTRILLHEITPLVAIVKAEVSKSLPDFDGSKSQQALNQMVYFLDAITELKLASSSPKVEELDLAELIRETTQLAAPETIQQKVYQQGPTPLLIKSDRGLLQLAIRNGLRNALDAISQVSQSEQSIVISWGETPAEFWMAILDTGPGIQTSPSDRLFQLGHTTKQGHHGIGLAIVRQAIESLQGTASLTPSTTGGAVFEIRWCK